MYNFCTKCGKENRSDTGVCSDCSTQAEPQFKTEKQPLPFAEPTPEKDFFENQTQPLNQSPGTANIQPLYTQQNLQPHQSSCPFCGGSGGIYKKSQISTGGFIYLAIMISITFFVFLILFPCAIVPFGLIFLVFLFKEEYFACVNCGQRAN